jgi:hypothetical protein
MAKSLIKSATGWQRDKLNEFETGNGLIAPEPQRPQARSAAVVHSHGPVTPRPCLIALGL